MSPKKQKNVGRVPENNSTDNDADAIATDSEVTNSLQQELREAINTMGPNTPKGYDEPTSDMEDHSRSNATHEALDCQCKPAPQEEVKELYKKNLQPTTDESQSACDFPDTSESYKEDVPLIVCPRYDNADEKSTQTKLVNKCHCLNENFVTIRKDPVPQQNRRPSRLDRNSITKWFRNRACVTKKDNVPEKEPPEFYKMSVTEAQDDHSPPRRLVFNLIDELPKPQCATVGVNTIPPKCQSKEAKDRDNRRAKCYPGEVKNFVGCGMSNRRNEAIHHKIQGCRCGIPARVDVYYFDHGNASYLRTTDNPPLIRTEIVADQSEECNNKFWGEVFGTIHIGISFITSFILQFFRFLLHSIIRPLIVGLLQISSDYFLKPCLATCFNGIIQPPLICCYNVSTSLRDICDPIAEGLGYFIKEISVLLRSCRLIDIKNTKSCEQAKINNNC